MINALIVDLTDASRTRIVDAGVTSLDDVRNAPALISFSDAMHGEAVLLKRFLRTNLYHHYQVNRMTSKARRIVRELFDAFTAEPRLLPPDYQGTEGNGSPAQARKVADYIAGMTDRYAMREHRRLFTIGET
jgi:dGTPase